MSTVGMAALLLVAATAGIARAAVAIRRHREETLPGRRVRGAPRVAIADANDGQQVCVVGDLVGELPLVAPFSGRRCVFWRVEVEEYVNNAFQTWAPCGNEESARTVFTLRDATGRAIVDSTRAEIVVDRSAGLRIADITPDATAARAWLARAGYAEIGLMLKRRYRYRESALTAADPIAVVGVGVRETDLTPAAGERGYRDAPPTVLRLGGGHQSLFITDAPDVTC